MKINYPAIEPLTVEEKRNFILQFVPRLQEIAPNRNFQKEITEFSDEEITKQYDEKWSLNWVWHEWVKGLTLSNRKEYIALTEKHGKRGVIELMRNKSYDSPAS